MRSSILTSFIFIIISLSLSITAYASSQSSVYLLDKISIKGPSITLGKISIIETQDLSLKQQLSTISLGPIPKVGGQVQISAYKIKKILQEKGLSNIEINGLQTHIQVSEKSIDKNMIQNMISKEIHHAFSDFQDISIQYIKIPKEWKVPDSEDLDFHIDMTKGKLKKHMTASLRASINNRILATLHLRLKINAFKNLLVAAQHIKKGEILSEDNLKIEKVSLNKINHNQIHSWQAIRGKISNRSIRKGQAIKTSDMVFPLIVKKGSLNNIVIKNGPITITLTGSEALENGRKGESIRFTNPMNPKDSLYGKIVSAGLAIVTIN